MSVEKLKWEFYGKDKIIIGASIFTLEEWQNRIENNFKRYKEKIEKQEKEIIEKCEKIDSLERDIGEYILEKEKQDKMIDYLVEIIEKNKDICDKLSTDECSLECKECIKEIARKEGNNG